MKNTTTDLIVIIVGLFSLFAKMLRRLFVTWIISSHQELSQSRHARDPNWLWVTFAVTLFLGRESPMIAMAHLWYRLQKRILTFDIRNDSVIKKNHLIHREIIITEKQFWGYYSLVLLIKTNSQKYKRDFYSNILLRYIMKYVI